MEKIGNDEVRVRVLHSGVGAITDTDVAGRGFEGADHRLQRPRQCDGAGFGHPEGGRDPLLFDHLRSGRRHQSRGFWFLKAEVREPSSAMRRSRGLQITGRRQGCGLPDHRGVARARLRLLRDNVVIHEGTLKTLKRFKDE
jgi:translation initiation factor IF-2